MRKWNTLQSNVLKNTKKQMVLFRRTTIDYKAKDLLRQVFLACSIFVGEYIILPHALHMINCFGIANMNRFRAGG